MQREGALSMKPKNIYLLLSVAGIALPYWQFLPWVMGNGLNMPLFWHQLFANRISAFFGMDVLVSAVALLIFVRASGSLRGFKRWLPLLAVLSVGVSLALPLFLYLSERGKEQAPAAIRQAAA
jgi:hypothetical protein